MGIENWVYKLEVYWMVIGMRDGNVKIRRVKRC